jgi:hypothetical protein
MMEVLFFRNASRAFNELLLYPLPVNRPVLPLITNDANNLVTLPVCWTYWSSAGLEQDIAYILTIKKI